MAKLIEFHVPKNYRARVLKVLPEGRGQVIEFRPRTADASDADNESLWRKFTLMPLRSAATERPGR